MIYGIRVDCVAVARLLLSYTPQGSYLSLGRKDNTEENQTDILLALAKKGASAAIPQEQARGGRWEKGKGGGTLANSRQALLPLFPLPIVPRALSFLPLSRAEPANIRGSSLRCS